MGAARSPSIRVVALTGFPEVRRGDDLAALIVERTRASALTPGDGDVFVIAQKIVSKAEDRYVDLRQVEPSPQAHDLARVTGKDARLVEVVLGDARRAVRTARDVLIVEHRLGFVMANGGVDHSNVGADEHFVLRLPDDPDASAARLHDALERDLHARVGVIINDSFGRPWRLGTVGVALERVV